MNFRFKKEEILTGTSTINVDPKFTMPTSEGYSEEHSGKKPALRFSGEKGRASHKSNLQEATSPLEMLEIIAEGGPHNFSPRKQSKYTEEFSDQNQDSKEDIDRDSQEDSKEGLEGSSPARSPSDRKHKDEDLSTEKQAQIHSLQYFF